MITDWELWACAQQVLTQHGDEAVGYVAERVAYLAIAGDMEGVATWRRTLTRRTRSQLMLWIVIARCCNPYAYGPVFSPA